MKYFKDMLSNLSSTQQEKSMPPQIGVEEQKYTIHYAGQPISEPKSFKQIVQDHGKIQDLERDPKLRVLPHKPKSATKPPPLPKLTKPMGKNQDIKIPKKEFIKEHKRLIDVLESPSHKDDLKEAKEQRKELKQQISKAQNYFQSLKKNFKKHKKYIAVVHKGVLSNGKYNSIPLFYAGNGFHREEPHQAMTFDSVEQGMKQFQKDWQSKSQDEKYKKNAPHPFDVSFIEDPRIGKWNEDESRYEDEKGNPILNADGTPFYPQIPEVEVVKPGSVNIHVNDPQNDYENQFKQKLAANLKNQGKKVNLTYAKASEQKVKRQTYEEAMKEIAEQQKIEDLKDQGYGDQEINQLKPVYGEKKDLTSTILAASEKYFQNLKKGSRQRKMPVDPNKESQMNAMIIDEWQNKQYTPTRGLIKPLTGNLRNRALHKLSGLTKVRRAKDGKREYLLYRGVSDSEKNSVLDDKSINYPENIHTSWSPHQGIAGRFASKGMGHVLGAWIHENDIHHYPRMTGNVYERHKGSKIKSPNDYAGEDEIIIRHSRPHEGYTTHSFSDKSNKLEFNVNSPIENKIKPLLEKPKIAAKLAASEKYFQNLKKSNKQNQLLKCYFLSKLKKIDGVTTTTVPPVTSPGQTGPSLNGTSLKEQPKGAKGDASPAGQVSQSFQSSLGMPAVRGAARRIMCAFGKNEELDKGAKGDWQKEGYKIKEGKSSDFYVIEAHHPEHGIIGKAHFKANPSGTKLIPHHVFVKPEHQRKGIGSAMYQHAEKLFETPIVDKASHQTSAAKYFWAQKNRPFGKNKNK